MRATWLFVVGISALACKDKEPTAAPKPAAEPAPPAATPDPPPSAPAAPAHSAPELPTLDVGSEFAAEQEDAAWAQSTEKAIAAAAPELTGVECRKSRCRATLSAADESELVARAEKIQEPSGLPSTRAKNVLLGAPRVVDGKQVMTIYVRYDR